MPLEHIQSSTYTAAFLLSILFASLLLRHRKTHHFLTAFLCIDALGFACEWLMLNSPEPYHHAWLSLLMVSSFFLAPCLWLFASTVAGKTIALRSLPVWHGGFIVIGFLLAMPLFLASNAFFTFEVSKLFGKTIHITMILCIGLFSVQVPIYLSRCVNILIGQIGRVKFFSASLQHSSLSILRVLILLVTTNWLVNIVRTFNVWSLQNSFTVSFISVLVDALATIIGLTILFHQIVARNALEADNPSDIQAKTSNGKYTKVSLDSETRARILKKLSDMNNLSPHLCANNISLTNLAAATGEKSQYITQVLNQDLGTNFYEYVTAHRIQEVKKKLISNPDESILKIAYDTGFNSKSTFNAAFKKYTGATPSAFRADQRPSKFSRP